ncbi:MULTISPECIES: AAA family ATPase [Pseudanabaena]|uniref:AAA family ATPase n=1 Tax=Pseudanabaena TaxID=1152 RepID=UPI00247AEC13|nr:MULTISPECIES: AAA family ATPase [Pseudanabaena]MEA5488986.1 AAA family ATPase [Pseudanabaena sp. CCNP1317]WGS73321.1 AAA family ATPase [Pseudanabaena galeata CCNP1313]
MTNQPKKYIRGSKSAAANSETPPAYFLSLEVENVLCFKEKQELKLCDSNGNPAQWTVILGNNGVGKTTLLRCLNRMELILDKSVNVAFPFRLSANQDADTLQELESLKSNGAIIYTKIVNGNTLSEIKSNHREKSIEHSYKSTVGYALEGQRKDLCGLICYGYGATRRMGKTSLSDSLSHDNSVSLFSDNATLINAEEWLLQTDYAIKSMRSEQDIRTSAESHARRKKQYNQIIGVLKSILPDVEDVRIELDEDTERPIAKFLTPYGWVQLSSLGLGYRTTIAWMVDLAVRLFKRYPDSEDPLAEPAIVLVDEIDLHMHPQWQRTIMEFLTERFPNTQFIVTAHSPLVVQAAQDANIVLLRREGDRVVIDNNLEIIENWRVDQVLTSVFEMPSARPAKIEPLLDRRQEILTKSKLTKADKEELKELEEKIGTLPTAETSEDIKAMDIIRRAAKLLEKPMTEAVE